MEEAIRKMMLENTSVQHKEVNNCLPSTLRSLIEQTVKKVGSSPETIVQISKDEID